VQQRSCPRRSGKKLAILALARSETISDLAARHGVSRKFVYRQTDKASIALDDAFLSATPENEVLFELAVTKTWLRQAIVALPLICRSSYRGVVEFMRDLLGVRISLGTVHDVLRSATRQACVINHEQDLSTIRVGLHDEIFRGTIPVLAGLFAASTYCYLLAAVDHRDADTWGVHLLDAAKQGLDPDYTIADAGQGLRGGQKPPGATHRAMAMCFTSSISTKASPTRCRASPRAPRRGARSCRPRLIARLPVIRMMNLSSSWSLPGRSNQSALAGPRHSNTHSMVEPGCSGACRTSSGHTTSAVRLYCRGTGAPRARGCATHPTDTRRVTESAQRLACLCWRA
jgi:hypothetical protein